MGESEIETEFEFERQGEDRRTAAPLYGLDVWMMRAVSLHGSVLGCELRIYRSIDVCAVLSRHPTLVVFPPPPRVPPSRG